MLYATTQTVIVSKPYNKSLSQPLPGSYTVISDYTVSTPEQSHNT